MSIRPFHLPLDPLDDELLDTPSEALALASALAEVDVDDAADAETDPVAGPSIAISHSRMLAKTSTVRMSRTPAEPELLRPGLDRGRPLDRLTV